LTKTETATKNRKKKTKLRLQAVVILPQGKMGRIKSEENTSQIPRAGPGTNHKEGKRRKQAKQDI
jgi:hypothetical protein